MEINMEQLLRETTLYADVHELRRAAAQRIAAETEQANRELTRLNDIAYKYAIVETKVVQLQREKDSADAALTTSRATNASYKDQVWGMGRAIADHEARQSLARDTEKRQSDRIAELKQQFTEQKNLAESYAAVNNDLQTQKQSQRKQHEEDLALREKQSKGLILDLEKNVAETVDSRDFFASSFQAIRVAFGLVTAELKEEAEARLKANVQLTRSSSEAAKLARELKDSRETFRRERKEKIGAESLQSEAQEACRQAIERCGELERSLAKERKSRAEERVEQQLTDRAAVQVYSDIQHYMQRLGVAFALNSHRLGGRLDTHDDESNEPKSGIRPTLPSTPPNTIPLRNLLPTPGQSPCTTDREHIATNASSRALRKAVSASFTKTRPRIGSAPVVPCMATNVPPTSQANSTPLGARRDSGRLQSASAIWRSAEPSGEQRATAPPRDLHSEYWRDSRPANQSYPPRRRSERSPPPRMDQERAYQKRRADGPPDVSRAPKRPIQ